MLRHCWPRSFRSTQYRSAPVAARRISSSKRPRRSWPRNWQSGRNSIGAIWPCSGSARRCPIGSRLVRSSPKSRRTWAPAARPASCSIRADEVFGWDMKIQGSEERVLDSVLPHEVTHTIFASHFRQPLPRWADEGACTTVEHVSETQQAASDAGQLLAHRSRHRLRQDVRHEGLSARCVAACTRRAIRWRGS